MKYWIFDGRQAQGPYEIEELKRLPGFDPQTLIAPEQASSAEQWRAAQYYLIKPPRPKAKPQTQSVKSIPVAVKPDSPADQSGGLPWKRLISVVIVLTGLTALAATLFWPSRIIDKLKMPAPSKPTPAAPAPVVQTPQPQSQIPEAERQEAQEAAIDFVKNFPLQSAGPKYPASAMDVFSARQWRAPATLGELFELKAFHSLAFLAHATLQKQGHSLSQGEMEISKNKQRWESYARKALKTDFKTSWSAETIAGPVLRVTIVTQNRSSEEKRAFEADLERKTLKPLDLDSWFDLDPKKCAQWGHRYLRLTENLDETGFSAAPTYTIKPPGPGKAQRLSRTGPAHQASPTASPRPQTQPEPEPELEPAGLGEGEESVAQEFMEEEDGAPPPAADKQSAAAPEASKKGPPAESAPTAPAKPSPSSSDPSPAKKKNAADMSLNELEQYLKGEKQKP